MKVLVVGMTDNPGGIESVIMNYVRNADPERLHFDFLATFPHIAYEEELRGRGSAITSIAARGANPMRFRRELDAFMRDHAADYDAIWVNLCNLVNIDFLKAADKYGIPRRIIHCHNSQNMDGWVKNLVHTMHRREITKVATDYWTCSDAASDWFYGPGIRSNPRYAYIPNAVNPDDVAFDPAKRAEVRARMGWDDAVVLGNVARLHSQKNQGFLLRALRPLLTGDTPYRLALVGDGELRAQTEDLARELGVTDHVEFLGVRPDVKELYNGMDAFVLPSLFEGVSMSFLEAQANGLPSLISDTLSDEGIVNDTVRKLPIDEAGAAQWQEAVRGLADAPERTGENGVRGSAYDIHTQLEAMYRRLGQ